MLVSQVRNKIVLIACQRARKQLVDIFGGNKNIALSFATEKPNKIPRILKEKKKNKNRQNREKKACQGIHSPSNMMAWIPIKVP